MISLVKTNMAASSNEADVPPLAEVGGEGATKTSTKFESALLLTDEQILQQGLPASQVEMYRRMMYTKAFGIESWTHDSPLALHSFPTKFLPLTYDQSIALLRHCRAAHDKSIFSSEGNNGSEEKNNHVEKENDQVEEIKTAIDALVKEHFPTGRWFIKLDTRSAKDAVLYDFDSARIQQHISAALQGVSPTDLSGRNLAFVRATNRCLECQTADDAMYVCFFSNKSCFVASSIFHSQKSN